MSNNPPYCSYLKGAASNHHCYHTRFFIITETVLQHCLLISKRVIRDPNCVATLPDIKVWTFAALRPPSLPLPLPPCFNSSLPPHSSPFFWKSDLTVYSLFLFFGIPPIHYIIVAVVKWNVPVSLICLAVLCLSDNVCACSLIERRPAGRGAPACPDRRKSSPGKTIDGSASLYGRPMYPCLVVVESMHALEVSESGSPQI